MIEFTTIEIAPETFSYDYAIKTAYSVFLFMSDICLGTVARSEHNEWVARDAKGNLWASFGKTRKEAINALYWHHTYGGNFSRSFLGGTV
jgi:hypothetical protein